MWRDLFGQTGQQPPLLPFIAVGFDHGAFVRGMNLALPCHAGQIVLAVYEWRSGQFFSAIRHLLTPHAEVFDVHAAFGQTEVRLIVPPPRLRQLWLINGLIFVGDAVFIKPIGDLQLFVTLNLLTLQGAQVLLFHMGVEFVFGFEIPFCLRLDQKMRKPIDDSARHGRHRMNEVLQDLLYQRAERNIIGRVVGKGRF